MPSCLSGLVRVGWGLQQTACYVTSCLSGLVRVGWGGGCYVPSCLSGLVRVGGVTCRPVCRGWLGWGVLRPVCRG